MKREVAKITVEKGVNECTRLTEIYEKKRSELEIEHEKVRQKFEEEKNKVCKWNLFLIISSICLLKLINFVMFIQVKLALKAEYTSRCLSVLPNTISELLPESNADWISSINGKKIIESSFKIFNLKL